MKTQNGEAGWQVARGNRKVCGQVVTLSDVLLYSQAHQSCMLQA